MPNPRDDHKQPLDGKTIKEITTVVTRTPEGRPQAMWQITATDGFVHWLSLTNVDFWEWRAQGQNATAPSLNATQPITWRQDVPTEENEFTGSVTILGRPIDVCSVYWRENRGVWEWNVDLPGEAVRDAGEPTVDEAMAKCQASLDAWANSLKP